MQKVLRQPLILFEDYRKKYMKKQFFRKKFLGKVCNIFLGVLAFLPLVVFAQPPASGGGATNFYGTLSPVLGGIIYYISALIPFALTLSVLFFLWGLAKFVYDAGNEKTHEDGRRIMIWGVVAVFVFVSIWGIAFVILETFNISPTNLPGVSSVVGPAGRDNTLLEIVKNEYRPLAELVQATLLFSTWLVFFYGIARFMWSLSQGDEDGIETGKLLLVWGVIVFTVSISFWGIMSALAVATGSVPDGSYMILFPQFKE